MKKCTKDNPCHSQQVYYEVAENYKLNEFNECFFCKVDLLELFFEIDNKKD